MESEPGQTAQSPGRGSCNFSNDIPPTHKMRQLTCSILMYGLRHSNTRGVP